MKSFPSLLRMVASKGLVTTYKDMLPEMSRDSVEWIERQGLVLQSARVLEIGCGRASTAQLLQERGADVAAFDIEHDAVRHARSDGLKAFVGDATALPCRSGALDLLVSVNVVCHIQHPSQFFEEAYRSLRPGGYAYVTWTNWYSPMGGHDFAPYHYLGPRLGYNLACRMKHKDGFIQVPFQSLWPNHIGPTLRVMRQSGFRILGITPRYDPSLALICRVPVVREFLTWNCQVMLQKPVRGQP